MGEYDIFFVEKKEDGDWSNPVNIGYPINTTNDNLYYFPIDRYTGLMSLKRESDDSPCHLQNHDQSLIDFVLLYIKLILQRNHMGIWGQRFISHVCNCIIYPKTKQV